MGQRRWGRVWGVLQGLHLGLLGGVWMEIVCGGGGVWFGLGNRSGGIFVREVAALLPVVEEWSSSLQLCDVGF